MSPANDHSKKYIHFCINNLFFLASFSIRPELYLYFCIEFICLRNVIFMRIIQNNPDSIKSMTFNFNRWRRRRWEKKPAEMNFWSTMNELKFCSNGKCYLWTVEMWFRWKNRILCHTEHKYWYEYPSRVHFLFLCSSIRRKQKKTSKLTFLLHSFKQNSRKANHVYPL